MTGSFRLPTRSGRSIVVVPEHAVRPVDVHANAWRERELQQDPFGRGAFARARDDRWFGGAGSSASRELVVVDLGIQAAPGRALWNSADEVIDWDALPRLADLTTVATGSNEDALVVRQTRNDPDGAASIAEPPAPQAAATEVSVGTRAIRVELGALGFTTGGVLTLPRLGVGLWHPWAAVCAAARCLADTPISTLVALGHTDPEEPVEHARRRCDGLLHLLRGEREPWQALAAEWGRVEDVQALLGYLATARGWPLDRPDVSGVVDARTREVVRQFQHHCNVERAPTSPLEEDGIIGEHTLGACFDVARDDLRLWLEVNGLALQDLEQAAASAVTLLCEGHFKPHRGVPELPPHHRGRFIDLVLVPEQLAPPDLAMAPAGAGLYELEMIERVGLEGVRLPRLDAVLEIVLCEPAGQPVVGVRCEVKAAGGIVRAGATDASGLLRFEGLPGGACRIVVSRENGETWWVTGTTSS